MERRFDCYFFNKLFIKNYYKIKYRFSYICLFFIIIFLFLLSINFKLKHFIIQLKTILFKKDNKNEFKPISFKNKI